MTEEPTMTTPQKPQHLRAVPAGGGHRVDGLGAAGDAEAVVSDPATDAAEITALEERASMVSLPQVSNALMRTIAEPIAHAGLALTVGAAGAAVGGITGRTWPAAGIGAGANLFLLGLGMAVLGRQFSPAFRWAYLLLALAGGGGAGYALWAGSGAGKRR